MNWQRPFLFTPYKVIPPLLLSVTVYLSFFFLSLCPAGSSLVHQNTLWHSQSNFVSFCRPVVRSHNNLLRPTGELFLRISLLVTWSFHKMFNSLQRLFIWKACDLFSKSNVTVHNLQSYIDVKMTRERISFAFDPRDMLFIFSPKWIQLC